jgi:hypothetical protein
MENKLDKLFRDTLEQHSIAPSAHAWEKVATRFPNKNNTWTLSWRIAAAVALIGMMSWLAYDFGKEDAVEITKGTKVEQPSIKQSNQEVAVKVAVKEESPEETNDVESKKPEAIQRTVVKMTITKTEVAQPPAVENEKEKLLEDIQLDQNIASVEEVTEPVAIQEPSVKPAHARAMVIVYNLAPVESKQEVEPAKTNTLKKVLEFAKDVKSGDATTFASVRNWKDNFLSSEELVRVEKQNNE